MRKAERFFIIPAALALAIFIIVFFWSGTAALLTVAVLSVLEVTLSFDNAVVNAKVLEHMTRAWRRRFLTWGILISVVGTRLILPIILVALTAWESPLLITKLAFTDAAAYAALLQGARFALDAFGGAFLAMISLRYFFDSGKRVHWIRGIEMRLARLGDIEAIEIIIVLALLTGVSVCAAPTARVAVAVAGFFGIALSLALGSVMRYLSRDGRASGTGQSVGLFAYLEVLDTAFSFDGVVGAFALTFSIPLIVLGLGIGAYFVRSLTVYLTEEGILSSLVFIENGAYWAIFGLSLAMFASILAEVPEIVTGGIGLFFMLTSYYSSLKLQRAERVVR
ncbi:MAG: DUF475 domain-containing protein [Patescibacteria group bacterium]|nr:DUF475 domain-containing protein [Patescibacteria group bacterium]